MEKRLASWTEEKGWRESSASILNIYTEGHLFKGDSTLKRSVEATAHLPSKGGGGEHIETIPLADLCSCYTALTDRAKPYYRFVRDPIRS